jgi:serine/threonine-protein kinase
MIGKVISHYRILEKIGAGGMGVIYKAEDTRLKRTVALKFLPPHALDSENDRRRFVQEAQAAASLDHPNICTIYEIDETDDAFIAMGYIEGHTLTDKISAGALKLTDAIDVAIQVAQGLSEAHSKKIIHRDIKSANVMITSRGIAKIMDFGIAKLPGGHALTKTGTTMGTLTYMSPEQVQGDEVDRRSDLWSLGVLLYEMIAGRAPFRGDRAEALMYSIVNQEPEPLAAFRAGVPADLQRVVGKALAKRPSERYQNADDLIVDLNAVAREMGGVPSDRADTKRAGSRVAIAIAIGAVLVALLVVGRNYVFPPSSGAISSIAVLPLANLSQDPEQDFFADGMTDALIAGLAKIGKLRVISRTSAMQYKGRLKPLPEIAKELDVDAVLEGSVMRAGPRVRITAELINADTEEHIWADNYERDMRDVLALQSDVARAVASEIALKLTSEDRTRLDSTPSVDPAAFDAYMRGRFHWNKRTPQDILKGLEYFQQALTIDPGYALAYVGVADSYNSAISYQMMPPEEAVPKAKLAAQEALRLDPTLGEAHCALAALSDKECKFAELIGDYERAVRLSPNYGTARQWYAEALSRLGRHQEAIEQIHQARALDPLSLAINTSVAELYYNNRQYDAALEAALKVLDLDPSFAPAVGMTAKIYDMKGMSNPAVQYYKRYMTLSGLDPRVADAFAQAYEQGGMDGARRWYATSFREAAIGRLTLGYSLALVYAMLGDREQSLEWLEKLSDRHCWNVADLKVEPMFDSLRDDPRYLQLLKKVGLEG